MLNPFVDLLASIIQLYWWCVVVWCVLEMLISFRVVNAFQPFVQRLRYALNRLTGPVLTPIRKHLPDLGGLDIAPVILLLLLNFLQNALYRYFYNL